ncbi:MAG TPA: hypothetical protein VKR83_16490 [Ktedonobacteraceae bacterium]|nr:hypothetical protein [Ktedonobacteraceae bacterium]
MKRRMFFLLALVVGIVAVAVASSTFYLRLSSLASAPVSVDHLARTPNSAYKYGLCVEAYAYLQAGPADQHKTDYTFQDPFRPADDTIVPYLVGWNKSEKTASFQVIIMIGHLETFIETISHVTVLDGISVMLPDTQNRLQRSNEPQFIVSSLGTNGAVAVLDFTCPQQWSWKIVV